MQIKQNLGKEVSDLGHIRSVVLNLFGIVASEKNLMDFNHPFSKSSKLFLTIN